MARDDETAALRACRTARRVGHDIQLGVEAQMHERGDLMSGTG